MPSTPVKTVIVKLNDICRICGESIRVTGRGSLNMFRGEKSKKQLLSIRFSKLLRDEVVQVCGKSSRFVESQNVLATSVFGS